MKKIPAFMLLVYWSLSGIAQKTVDFNLTYKPEKKYSQTMVQISKNEIKYKGPQSQLKKLAAQGIENPTTSNTQSNIESVFLTGKTGADGHFPVQVKFGKVSSSNGIETLLKDMVIYGQGEDGKMPTLDSITGEGLDDKVKAAMLTMMQSMFTQLNFKEKIMKAGESFSIKTPISMPFANSKLDMDIKTTYKLVNISNGIANFNIDQVYTMTTTVENQKLKGSGTGTGQMQYNIADGFYNKYQVDTEMKITAAIDDIEVEVTAQSGILQTALVSDNH